MRHGRKIDPSKATHTFGWCNDGHCVTEAGGSGQCRGSFTSTMGIHKDMTLYCQCECHGEVPPWPDLGPREVDTTDDDSSNDEDEDLEDKETADVNA